MSLSSRHRIRNSSPGGLRPCTLPLGHGGSPQYWLSHVDGEETFFVSFKPPRPGTEPRTLAWKAAVLTTTLGPPPSYLEICAIVHFVKPGKLEMNIITYYSVTFFKQAEKNNHVKNKKYGDFVSISSLTDQCAAQKFKNFCSSSLWTCLHHMVIFGSQNKITDFFMI